MAASIATALKQLIEGAGLGLAAYRDALPTDQKDDLPAVVIRDTIDPVVEPGGDAGAGDTVTENVMVDLLERWVDESDEDNPVLAESYTLRDALIGAIHGRILPVTPKHVYGIRVVGWTRQPDRTANIVKTPISLKVRRSL